MINRKFSKWYFFLAITLASGLPWWLSSYHQYEQHFWLTTGISTTLAALAAVGLARRTDWKKIRVVLFAAWAHQLALLVKIVLDCIPDKTNHSLAPFEMIGVFIFDFMVIGVFVIAGRSIASIRKERLNR